MSLFNSRNGLLALLGFGIALVFFVSVILNLANQASTTIIASVPTATQTVLPSPTATNTSPLLSPTRTLQPTITATPVPPTQVPKPTATPPPTNTPSTISPIAGTIPKQAYSTLTIQSAATDRPAASHADLNLKLRGLAPIKSELELMDLEGATDGAAPQFSSLLTGSRDPVVKAVYRVNDWDWGCNCKAKPIDDPAVSLVGFGVTAGEPIHVPHANIDIGNKNQVMVLYADSDSITLGYTRNDNVTQGYVVHVAGVTIASDLLALYQQLNSAGRATLPALKEYQVLGVAQINEIKIAVRDTGTFMDPRSRKDWWRDKPLQLPPSMMKPRPSRGGK